MAEPDAIPTVLAFNDCINTQDLDGLAGLMSEAHLFIDSADNRVAGKDHCRQAWHSFFKTFPDYRNHVDSVITVGDLVVVRGRSTCVDPRLEGDAIWSARVADGLVTEWRVYKDTQVNRQRLGLDGGD